MSHKGHTKEEIEQMEDHTDYERLKNITEKKIRKNAEVDPDAPLQTEEDLKRFKLKFPKGKNHNKD